MELITLLDTNVCLYHFGDRIAEELPVGPHCISVMTEIELLSYPGIMERELATIEKFLAKIEVVGIDDQVVKAAVDIRKRHKLRLPDAVIGASAIVLGATLWTHDAKLKSALGPVSYSPNLK